VSRQQDDGPGGGDGEPVGFLRAVDPDACQQARRPHGERPEALRHHHQQLGDGVVADLVIQELRVGSGLTPQLGDDPQIDATLDDRDLDRKARGMRPRDRRIEDLQDRCGDRRVVGVKEVQGQQHVARRIAVGERGGHRGELRRQECRHGGDHQGP
jgi:hypothetical protein